MRRKYKTGWIYFLVDPDSTSGYDLSEVRYVGYSYNPEKRFKNHLTEARNKGKGHRCNWIRSLLRVGKEPVLVVVEQADYETLPDLEVAWIADLRQCYDLVNDTDGGDGCPGYSGPCNVSPEGKETKKAASDARKKQIENRETLSFHSDEARRKSHESLRGYKHSDESRQAFSEGATKRFEDPAERQKFRMPPRVSRSLRNTSVSWQKEPERLTTVCRM